MSTPSGAIQTTIGTNTPTTLFLADSNAADLHELANALTAAGYIVIKVTTGQQLLALLDRLVPDAILLASELPYQGDGVTATLLTDGPPSPMVHPPSESQPLQNPPHHTHIDDGFALCRLLAATTEWIDIPIILLTPTEDPKMRMRGIEMNAWGIVAKPFYLPELSSLINTLTQRAQAQRNRTEEHNQLQATFQQQAYELQRLHRQHRQCEQQSELLLTTVHAQSRQLYLLMTLALQNVDATKLPPRQRQQHFQQQASAIQAFLSYLSKLVAALPIPQPEAQQAHGQQLSFPAQPPSQWQAEQGQAEQWQADLDRQLPSLPEPSTRCTTAEAIAPTTKRPILSPPASKRRAPQLSQLSEREYEILIRLANGEGYEEISRILTISTSTVRSYRSRIMQKLGITTATELIKFAVRHRLIELS